MTREESKVLRFWNRKSTGYLPTKFFSEYDEWYANAMPLKDAFLRDGYLEISDCYENIRLKAVAELKAVLADRELKISGKKSELVQRIIDNFDRTEIEELFESGIYKLTEKGEEVIRYYSLYDNTYGLPYLRLQETRETNPQMGNEEIYQSLLQQDFNRQLETNEWRQLPATASYLSDLLLKHLLADEAFRLLSIAYHELYYGAKTVKFGIEEFKLFSQCIVTRMNIVLPALALSSNAIKHNYFSAILTLPGIEKSADNDVLWREFSVLRKLLNGELPLRVVTDRDVWGREYYEFITFPSNYKNIQTAHEEHIVGDNSAQALSTEDIIENTGLQTKVYEESEESSDSPSKLWVILFSVSVVIVLFMMFAGIILEIWPSIISSASP